MPRAILSAPALRAVVGIGPAVLWCWGAAAGCESVTPESPARLGSLAVSLGISSGVAAAAVSVTLECDDGLPHAVVAPLMEGVFDLVDSEASRFADAFFFLEAEACEVVALALDASGAAHPACAPGRAFATLVAGATTELVVAIPCARTDLQAVGPCLGFAPPCEHPSGLCPALPIPAGVLCTDNLVCTVGGVCDGVGSCGVPTPAACNDGWPCTEDECDPVVGCISLPVKPGCGWDRCPSGGDINGDGAVNVSDVQCTILLALWQLSGAAVAPPACLKGPLSVADLDCQGGTTVSDIQLDIRRALSVKLPPPIDANGNDCPDSCDRVACPDGVCAGQEDCLVCPEDCAACP
jgi:hypothetical protein